MKRIKYKLLCLSLALCGISPTLFSQGAYYYYENEKVPLGIHPHKASILVPKSVSTAATTFAEKQSSYNYEYTIQDDRFEHMVVNLTPSQTISYKRAATLAMPSVGESTIMLPVYKTDQFEELVLTNYLYVRLKKEGDGYLLDSIAKVYGIEIVDTNEWMPLWHTLSMTPQSKGSSLDIANTIFETGLFASAFPDFSYDMVESVSDDELNYQWGLRNKDNAVDIKALDAWDIATGKGVNIAVVDDGINRNHPDLIANMHPLRHNETDADETNHLSHGTQCALIIGAVKNNKMMIGVAYNAKIMEAKVPRDKTNATSKKLANCINWAWQNGADVISCSWEAYKNSMLKEAIDNAIDKGRNGKGGIFINSAGNTNGDVTWPADYRPEILVVSAINRNGERWDNTRFGGSGSSYGESVDVCAPGQDIRTWDADGKDHDGDGTSYSCPYVAGIAALVLERNPYLTGQEVSDIIERTANKTACSNFNANSETKTNGSWNKEYGYGLVNAAAAVKSACIDKTVSGQISASQKVVGCSIKAQNVSVTGTATLTLEALEQVELQGTLDVPNGATLEINVKR